jgi:hypothetical protein
MVRKPYREATVVAAIEQWDISEWFTANSLQEKVKQVAPQKNMTLSVRSIGNYLRMLEARGLLEARSSKFHCKEYTPVKGEWPDGCYHFHA